MASLKNSLRPLGCWSNLLKELRNQRPHRRGLHTRQSAYTGRPAFPLHIPEQFMTQIPPHLRPGRASKEVKIFPPLPSCASTCKDPISAFTADQLKVLDPTEERKTLFDPKNRQGVKVGDIIRVTFKNGDPFAGVCLNIRQRGVDTSFLLRNKLTRVSCEMWIKIYSPNVSKVEIVQKPAKRMRRANLTYLRHPKHDKGSVENIVRNYLRQKRALSNS
ncbi:hypothetical protein FQN57_001971 [Myotisia sp. PD_48]|nr:hypothetical protein FQN57_001971 [Myotisia sp. PD_48]